jgi:phosphinothricin acetyltransferase
MNIRPMKDTDGDAVMQIYQEGCDTGHATFAETAGSWAEFDSDHLSDCRLVAEGDAVLGWAALSGTSSRCVYRGVAEVSLYVGANARGQGAGTQLLQALIAATEAENIWTLQALIFLENTASLALFAKHGFRHLAVHERLGRMEHGPLAGHWRDVALLERRSEIAGQ